MGEKIRAEFASDTSLRTEGLTLYHNVKQES